MHPSGQGEPRSADGILQAESGVAQFFEGCVLASLQEALCDIHLAAEGSALELQYWMCPQCGQPTSEDVAEHMRHKHCATEPRGLPESLQVQHLLDLVQDAPRPAITVYSSESPIYRASNRAMRQWQTDSTAFQKWRTFAYLLHRELQLLPRFEGSVYRAVPRRVPVALYRTGNVVTWNQPSSTSEDPRVARHFLKVKRGGRPWGTVFIIKSTTGRSIQEYSLHPEEMEVLFPTGTQFQVVNHADAGVCVQCEFRPEGFEPTWCSDFRLLLSLRS